MAEIFTYDRGAIATLIKSVAVAGDYLSDEVAVVANYSAYRLPNNYTWEIVIENGTYSAFTALLEISLDALSWYQADSNFGALVSSMQHIVNKPTRYMRVHITTATVATGTPKVTARVAM